MFLEIHLGAPEYETPFLNVTNFPLSTIAPLKRGRYSIE
jgi:hypothetical protein